MGNVLSFTVLVIQWHSTVHRDEVPVAKCIMSEEIARKEMKYLQSKTLICEQCKTAHLKDDIHIQNQETSEKVIERVKLKTVECLIHSDEDYCNYCDTCSALVCPSCLVESHQMHRLQKLMDVYD